MAVKIDNPVMRRLWLDVNDPKLIQRDYNIKNVSLSTDDLNKFFELIEEFTASARKIQVEDAVKNPNPNIKKSREELEAEAEDNFVISHTIRDASDQIGISGTGIPDFSSENLSGELRSVWITNREVFQQIYGRPPRNYIDIYIDFSRVSIAMSAKDFPSNPTDNGSCLNIKGFDEAWVVALHQKLIEFFDKRKTIWGWMHVSGVYDCFLYLLVVPFVLFKAYQFETSYPDLIFSSLNVAALAFLVYGLLLSMILAKQFFMFIRWLYPLVEYSSGNRKSPTKYRTFISTMVVGLIFWGLQNVISTIFF